MTSPAELDKMTAPLAPLLVMFYVFAIIKTVSTLARFYARIYVLRQFGADDFFMIFSLVNVPGMWSMTQLYKKYLWLLETAVAKGPEVANDGHWFDVASEAEKLLWMMSVTYPLFLTLFKLSILAFYGRFLPRQPYRVWIYATAICSVLFGIAATLATVFQCIPVQKAWDARAGNRYSYRRIELLSLFVAIGSFNLVTDVILVGMPLPVVLRLHTNLKRKVGLVLLFSLCMFGTALTAVRLWKTVHLKVLERGDVPAARWVVEVLMLVLLSGFEMAVIPLCANMPALAALWRSRGRRTANNRNNNSRFPQDNYSPPPPNVRGNHEPYCATAAAAKTRTFSSSSASGAAALPEKVPQDEGSGGVTSGAVDVYGAGAAGAGARSSWGKRASRTSGGCRGGGGGRASSNGLSYGDDSISVSAWELEDHDAGECVGKAAAGLSAPPPPPPPAYAQEELTAAATTAVVGHSEYQVATSAAIPAALGCEYGGPCSCGLVTESSGDERSISLSCSSSVEEIRVAYGAGAV